MFDIIQLLNTTRKSGTFSVKGEKGESRIIFSNGCIVGANHLNGKVRIGTVLVKMKAISVEDLGKALDVQKNAGKSRKPLIATLIKMGRLGREEAATGLKKLIEMTIVELVGWSTGSFTLDTEAIAVSPECSYPISKMEQEVSLDAQMVLMDALRIFDERERDRKAGKELPPDEEVFGDIVSEEEVLEAELAEPILTADDLGLGALEQLERKIPQPFSVDEIFDPLEIHRETVKDMLAGFSAEEQEAFASFLERSTASMMDARGASSRQEGRTSALVLVSGDELMAHSVMTVCKDKSVLVFTTGSEEETDQSIERCLGIKISPVVVFDGPEASSALTGEKIVGLRQRVKERFPGVSIIQLVSPRDYTFALETFRQGMGAVFPRPLREADNAAFIRDMICFLETFNTHVRTLFSEQGNERKSAEAPQDDRLGILRQRFSAFRELNEPSAVSLALLESVAESFERSISFIIHQTVLTGEKAVGLYGEKSAGATSAAALEIPLTKPSIFSDTIEKGRLFIGESDDEVLKAHLFAEIGPPRNPVIMLLPMRSLGRAVILTYADFGDKEPSSVPNDFLEVLADEAGMVMENTLYRKHLSKAQKK